MLDAWQTVWVCVILSIIVLALDAWQAGQGPGTQRAIDLAEKRAKRQKQMTSGQPLAGSIQNGRNGDQK